MIVIVIGMHRSGTSAISGILHMHGIIMGEEKNFIPAPQPENPRGFFENYRFRLLNDGILEGGGYTIKSWETNIPSFEVTLRQKLKMLWFLRSYSHRYGNWGWKDPRTCLTLQSWLTEAKSCGLLHRCKLVWLFRNPYSVAESMVRRGDTDFETSLTLWVRYHERALAAGKRTSIPQCFFTYESFCENPVATSEALLNFIDTPLKPEVISELFDRKLNHSLEETFAFNPPASLIDEVEEMKGNLTRFAAQKVAGGTDPAVGFDQTAWKKSIVSS